MGKARRCSKKSKRIYNRGYIISKADGVKVVSKRKNQMQIAIIGDFNHTIDNMLDRMHSQTVNYKRLLVSTG
ncbi:46514_t:CDS:2 [Gigaspora margarita]|uniref:46514_t:CDS:1 n=1 Tax=Gigaspora margarita TaxID=4874 RepID=A0ABN7UKF4_GIGMA|nr:46514_t:CDS:2 [Gigaspora margarita]